jgi:hypothetical protein
MFCDKGGRKSEWLSGFARLDWLDHRFAKNLIAWMAAAMLFCHAARGSEIRLADFSGNESIVDGSSFSSLNIAPGVQLLGGKERSMFYVSNAQYPFLSPPTDGDPAGLSGASGTGWLSTFLPPGGLYWPLGLTFSFSGMTERPNRVGLLVEHFGSAPYYNRLGVSLTLEGGGSSYYEYDSGRRLLAFQEEAGIVEMNLRWSPGTTLGDGPRISVDDLRYETVAVPEPSADVLGLVGGAIASVALWQTRQKKRNRANSSGNSARCLEGRSAGRSSASLITV